MIEDDSDPDEETTAPPRFLSSLPDRPITDDVVRRTGESDNPKIRGATALPGSDPVVDRAAEICNEWLAESLSARIDAAERG